MELMMVDPRALKENPDQMRRSKSSLQADALLLASIKAVGIVQPPVILPECDGGNGYVIHFGHRRVAQAIADRLVVDDQDVLTHVAGQFPRSSVDQRIEDCRGMCRADARSARSGREIEPHQRASCLAGEQFD